MLEELLRSHADQMPQAVALRIERDGAWRAWTYAEVWSQARSAAAGLRCLGVRPGDRVALYADNSPEWALAYLGIYLAAAVVVPLDAQYTERELRTILDFAGCRLVLCSSSKQEVVEAVGREGILIDGESPLFGAPPLEGITARRPEELMAVIFTSGTTGEPKGVCLTVGNITANLESIRQLGLIGRRDTALALLPMHHCYALTTSILTPLIVGGSITMCTSFRGPDILAAMQKTGVTVVLGVPKLFEGFDRAIMDKVHQASRTKQRIFRILSGFSRRCRRRIGWNPGRLLFRSIHATFGPRFRFFASGGAKLDPVITDRFLDLGVRVVEGYGLTETSPVVSFNPVDGIKPGSVGRPLPGVEVRIDQPNRDGIGEILIRGANVMAGYDRREEETATVIRDGWFHTGDLGCIDRDGYIFITGRAKEVIVLGSGKNIYPEDVERHYEQSPIVKEICVMPVELPDGRVERLCAVVTPAFDELQRRRAGSVYEEIHHEITMRSQQLPTYMRVTDLKIVTNELPRTRLGKLRRAEIRRMAFDEVHESAGVLSPQDQVLLSMPGADRLLDRIRGVSGYKGEIVPGQNLEIDLGLDSLARIELGVVLEQEFGLRISPGEAGEVHRVGDLLRRLGPAAAGGAGMAGWKEILGQPVSPPAAQEYNLRRGAVARWGLNSLRHLALTVARRSFPLDVRGAELLPVGRPFLLCPTHASLIDSALVFVGLPDAAADRMFYLGAADHFETAIMRRLGRIGRVIPTATSDTTLASLRRTAEVLRMGWSVCIFPEGFISRDGYLGRPRPGAGILACEVRVPIVPVLVRGTYEIMSYTHRGFRLRPVGLTFGAAIEPPVKESYDNRDYACMMDAWVRAVTALREEDDRSGRPTAGRSPRIKT